MKLVHYASHEIGHLYSATQESRPAMKPQGLWLSDDDCGDNWATWCRSEGFKIENLSHAHEISLSLHARILHIKSPKALSLFTSEFSIPTPEISETVLWIDWRRVAQRYQGVIISPYYWKCRMDNDTFWYYGWDCASGCIWDAAAIAKVRLCHLTPPQKCGSLNEPGRKTPERDRPTRYDVRR